MLSWYLISRHGFNVECNDDSDRGCRNPDHDRQFILRGPTGWEETVQRELGGMVDRFDHRCPVRLNCPPETDVEVPEYLTRNSFELVTIPERSQPEEHQASKPLT